MKNKIIFVSVGIPAYNEVSNIKNILLDVLNQSNAGWSLKEIIVSCEGSTDHTAERAKEIHSPYITIIRGKRRKGKSYALNGIFLRAKGDLIVLFDADHRLGHKNVISQLVSVFRLKKNIALVAGNRQPFPPKNFIERGIFSTFKVFYKSRLSIQSGRNIFACQGGCIALRTSFAKSLMLPPIINDDAYMYLTCVTNGYRFEYVDDAVAYYKSAKTIGDYLKQLFRSRPESVHLFLKQYFGDRVKEEFHRPFKLYIAEIFKAFLEDPFPTAFIIMVNVLATPFIPILAPRYRSSWPMATSTK